MTPPPPPLTLKLTYVSPAVVDEQTGTVVVQGRITCSRSVNATVTVSIGQQLGNSAPRTGVAKSTVGCAAKTVGWPRPPTGPPSA